MVFFHSFVNVYQRVEPFPQNVMDDVHHFPAQRGWVILPMMENEDPQPALNWCENHVAVGFSSISLVVNHGYITSYPFQQWVTNQQKLWCWRSRSKVALRTFHNYRPRPSRPVDSGRPKRKTIVFARCLLQLDVSWPFMNGDFKLKGSAQSTFRLLLLFFGNYSLAGLDTFDPFPTTAGYFISPQRRENFHQQWPVLGLPSAWQVMFHIATRLENKFESEGLTVKGRVFWVTCSWLQSEKL